MPERRPIPTIKHEMRTALSAEFITLHDLAVMAGDPIPCAEWYFQILSNDEFGPLRPFVPIDGTLTQASAKRLAWDWEDRVDAVRVRLEDAQDYIAEADAEAEAAKYSTWERYTYQLDDDRDRRDQSHPVHAVDGSPAFDLFASPRHVASWLARGGSLSDAPANVLALMNETSPWKPAQDPS